MREYRSQQARQLRLSRLALLLQLRCLCLLVPWVRHGPSSWQGWGQAVTSVVHQVPQVHQLLRPLRVPKALTALLARLLRGKLLAAHQQLQVLQAVSSSSCAQHWLASSVPVPIAVMLAVAMLGVGMRLRLTCASMRKGDCSPTGMRVSMAMMQLRQRLHLLQRLFLRDHGR